MHAMREEARARRRLLGVPPLRRQAQAVRRMRAGAGTREVRRAAGAAVVRLALVRPTPLSAAACGAASTCAAFESGGGSPSSNSPRASSSTHATGTTSPATTTRGSIPPTGCAPTRTTSTRTPPLPSNSPCLRSPVRGAEQRARRLGGDVTDDPAASSFAKAMETSIGTVTIIDPNAEVFGRIWCVLCATQ